MGHVSDRKPDLFLYPPGISDPDWADVLVVGEMKQNRALSLDVKMIVQFAGYARTMFATQHTRRFVHGFTLCGEYMRCWLFHRGGMMGSDEFNINTQPEMFLSAIIGYAAMSESELGFDTTISFTQEGILVGVMEERIRLDRKPVFKTEAIAARGTTCWDATLTNDAAARYVLKDSWRSIMYGHEGVMLAKAQERGVVGIVEYIAHEDVMVDGKIDDLFDNVMKGLQVGKAINLRLPSTKFSTRGDRSLADGTSPEGASQQELANNNTEQILHSSAQLTSTGQRRSSKHSADGPALTSSARKRSKPSPTVFNRIHTRILTVKGQPITIFTSVPELIRAFHDAITGHRSLFENGILHRDVSINNIMINLADQPRADGLGGFLIDLDLAVETKNIDPSGAPHRTGTTEFMAIGTLKREVHRFHHDLESFFYVLIWICVHYRPAYNGRSKGSLSPKDILDLWGSDYHVAATVKWSHISRAPEGSDFGLEGVMNAFEDWAEPIKPLVRGMRDFIFPLVGGMVLVADDVVLYDNLLRLLEGFQEV